MSLTVTQQVVDATTHQAFERLRSMAHRNDDREYELAVAPLDAEALEDLRTACEGAGDKKTVRAIGAIQKAREGKFDTQVPNFKAFEGMLRAFLAKDLIDGWVYVRGVDGKLYPELVVDVEFRENRVGRDKDEPKVYLRTTCYSRGEGRHGKGMAIVHRSHVFSPTDVIHKRMADAFAAMDILKETAELRAEFAQSIGRHNALTSKGFTKQFRMSGTVSHFEESNWQRRGETLQNRKVVHDLDKSEYAPFPPNAESFLFDHEAEVGSVPEHPLVRVFDLKSHEFYWVNADYLTPYVYDKSLRDKLILPKTHRDLLDVLTTDLDAFAADIIEGKSAGNIILCKGRPGVGKTLTAEVYAELVEAPLYSIHSGTLGIDAAEIEANLLKAFARAKRWGAIILLDEADVYVMQRGTDLVQNSVVAVLLRTLEYIDILMFLTTNRSTEIDDAIVPRCAATIEYKVPSADDCAKIWRVMSDNFEAGLTDKLIAELVELFPSIAPRDIKHLLRLTLRVARAHKKELTADLFRQGAMFRAIQIAEEKLTS